MNCVKTTSLTANITSKTKRIYSEYLEFVRFHLVVLIKNEQFRQLKTLNSNRVIINISVDDCYDKPSWKMLEKFAIKIAVEKCFIVCLFFLFERTACELLIISYCDSHS